MSQTQHRQHIVQEYPALLAMACQEKQSTSPFRLEETRLIYRTLAERCLSCIDSEPHAAVLCEFLDRLAQSAGSLKTEQAIRQLSTKMKVLPPLWLFTQEGPEWLVFQVHGDGAIEELAHVATAKIATKLIEHCANGIPPAISENLPGDHFVIEGQNGSFDVHTMVRIEEDGDEILDEVWIARVHTMDMAEAVAAS